MQVNSSKQERVCSLIKNFRDSIITMYQAYEPENSFKRTHWSYEKGKGGGEISLIRGDVFEKAACNFSAIHGSSFPGKDASGPFFATGVSTITHMLNPKAPTFHFNVRYIETESSYWIGGGFDMTPMGFFFDEDTALLHSQAKQALDQVNPDLYPKLSEQAKKYFYLPHRKKERGAGGIFFDHFSLGDFEQDLDFLQRVTSSYIAIAQTIIDRRISMPWTSEDKKLQNQLRAHYVEFNLIYDRGTRFGFQSGGNPDAILCSMPPVATW
ncbi:coproporphyrinogen III oxidase [Candidatus Aerophobetes bacterium]|uniref:coproporphyrinogen oxidase n=1 Tax=Aerophobetes bacterium TaxID=2030807 RepID=A0A2A4X680_UNCAE|nr:MAG: coproporphyrinogen III oxidase [Candidatus Aerophobetes bacterium]